MVKTEEKIIKLLGHKPQDAMVSIIEQYTGLLWKISKNYLLNPEDIKECINDSFLEFYRVKDRFDPNKGSLAIFLGTITRNQAISKYRKLSSHQTTSLTREAADTKDVIEQLEAQIDLNEAISSLNPEYAQIIRMKYYDGMTIQEIADSMHLPYETVKKRHQRSLSKLRWLLMVLITVSLIAALSACAYLALRRLGLIPGFGISSLADTPVYLLKEPVEKQIEYEYQIWGDEQLQNEIHSSLVRCSVAEAYIIEGNVTLLLSLEAEGGLLHYSVTNMTLRQNGENLTGQGIYCVLSETGQYYIRYQFSGLSTTLNEEEITLMAVLPYDIGEVPITFNRFHPEEATDFIFETAKWGSLVAMPRWEEGHLLIGIQPLNYNDYSISPYLITDRYRQGKVDDITVTDAEGTAYIGEMLYRPLGDLTYFDWDFGTLPAGNYTLHVPYVYLDIPINEKIYLIDLEQATWENQEISIPGGTLSIVDCHDLGTVHISDDYVYNEWQITFHFEKNSDLELFQLFLYFDFLDESGELIDVDSGGCSFNNEIWEAGTIQCILHVEPGDYDRSRCQIHLSDSLIFQWEHEFELPVSIIQ